MAQIRITTSRKKILTSIVLVVVVLIASAVIFINFGMQKNDNEEKSPAISNEDMQIKAAEYFDTGDIEGGLNYYDEQIELKKEDTEKQSILVQKAGFARMSGRADASIEAAKKADDMGSNPETLRALAEAYAASGDKVQAIAYYKRLIEVLPADDSGNGISRGPSPEEIIKRLEQ